MGSPSFLLVFVSLLAASETGHGWTAGPYRTARAVSAVTPSALQSSASWFADVVAPQEATGVISSSSMEREKARLLHLGAILDRGQAYNPTSGDYYAERRDAAHAAVESFVKAYGKPPTSMDELVGEWELVLTTVPYGIFRSSPFFLAIQEAYETAGAGDKANLFFKLHELQTLSWGISKVGRVAQHITKDRLYSEFDTSIFSLTVIPILGWFKLLPTFGGCVVTAASAKLADPSTAREGEDDVAGRLDMVVDYTTARPVEGLSGLFGWDWVWRIKVPVGAVWKLLPWNKGREANCKVWVRYCDDDFRIVQDASGEYFVYTRPVLPRSLDLVDQE